ncbi:hypothetical protein [Halopseudomonas salegens]|uniref:Uncharacterized protein n=1 Tax=Halopseudomonas salegens TaxID=1434072 RepID=A0A1H2ETW8_9GAMM|nr:hypothetical protein [Halopseudomonas salegens]SDT98535.1 hypothetical protein SAMN05216210_1033 [Halopseudomonas salegens]
MSKYKSRRRWLMERWLRDRVDQAGHRAQVLWDQLRPASWAARCARLPHVAAHEVSQWRPEPGSSNAELLILLQPLPLIQRRWLAVLVDAPSAAPCTLLEAIARLQLDWEQRITPWKTHYDYAEQLHHLGRLLDIPVAAASAYLDNEKRIFAAIDQRLFESLPLRLRGPMANRLQPGHGGYLGWWQERLLARAGEAGYELADLGEDDWPELPASWYALGWLSGLRLAGPSITPHSLQQ